MATNGHSGYPLKWFIDQNVARDFWECAICLEVLKDPVQIRDCGHQFCALCIDDILETDAHCPSCRIRISGAMVFEDHAARRLIKKMDVNCCNEGCNWVGNLGSLVETHLDTCNFVVNIVSTSAKQSDVEELKAKLENLTIEISTLKEMHEAELKEMKIKYENDSKKRDEELKKLRDQISFFGTYLPPTFVQSLKELARNPTVTIALKIPDFTRRLSQARSSNSFGHIDGGPFYTSHGYKLSISTDLNEGPRGYTGYMGVYLNLMKGDHDDNLEWPFNKRVKFIVVDQQDSRQQVSNYEMTLIPEGQETFNRPVAESSKSYYCLSQFMPHSTLRTRQYIKNNAVYIVVAIEQ